MTPWKTLAGAAALILCAVLPGLAASASDLSRGQSVYVPAYSQIIHGRGSLELLLAVTLAVRNLDPDRSLTLTGVDYHDSSGRLVRRLLDGPVELPPLAAKTFLIEEKDTAGGVGASFLVRWRAAESVTPPLAEAVMVGSAQSLGVSFVSRGVVVREER